MVELMQKKKEKMIFNYTRIVKNFLKKLERDKLYFFKKRKTNSSTVHLAKTPFKVMKFWKSERFGLVISNSSVLLNKHATHISKKNVCLKSRVRKAHTQLLKQTWSFFWDEIEKIFAQCVWVCKLFITLRFVEKSPTSFLRAFRHKRHKSLRQPVEKPSLRAAAVAMGRSRCWGE